MSDETNHDIEEVAVKPQGLVKLGSLLAAIGREVKLTEDEFKVFENLRDRSPAQGANFGDGDGVSA